MLPFIYLCSVIGLMPSIATYLANIIVVNGIQKYEIHVYFFRYYVFYPLDYFDEQLVHERLPSNLLRNYSLFFHVYFVGISTIRVFIHLLYVIAV